MANAVFSRDQLAYVQLESTFGTIPNTAGTATLAGTNACRIISLSTDADQPTIDRPDKTGSLDYTAGQGGRRSGKWATKMSLAGSGTPATAPDCGPFLQAGFGKAPTSGSGILTYNVEDLSPSLAIFNYRKPSTATEEVAFGAVVDTMSVDIGGDVATMDFDGTALWVLDSDQFSTVDATGKGGLSGVFPPEPSSPSTNGNFAVGFKGQITLDGNVYTTVRTVKITAKWNRDVPQDQFNSNYGGTPGQDRRDITGVITMADDDSANLSALKVKAFSRATMALQFIVGTTAGNIWTFNFPQAQITPAKYDDSQRKWGLTINFKAIASGLATKDSFNLVLS